MGEALALIGKAREAKAALQTKIGTGSGVDTSDPGINLGDPTAGLQAPGPAAAAPTEGQGFSVAMPGGSAPVDPLAPLPNATTSSAQQPVDNPYVPDTPKELSQGDDITVTGDSWRPHKESTLGKIADTLLLLRGRAPVFRQRTDDANIRDAMKGYDRDPAAAIHRVGMVDTDAALKLRDYMEKMDANKLLQEERIQSMREKGYDRLAAVAGAITDPKVKDKETAYGQLLPTLRGLADQYHLDGENMFPDKYDPDKIGSIRAGGFTAYQQEALANQDQTNQRLTDQNAENIELRKQGLQIEQSNSEETARHNRATEGAKPQPPQIKRVLDADGNVVGVTDGKRALINRNGQRIEYDVRAGWNNAVVIPPKSPKG